MQIQVRLVEDLHRHGGAEQERGLAGQGAEEGVKGHRTTGCAAFDIIDDNPVAGFVHCGGNPLLEQGMILMDDQLRFGRRDGDGGIEIDPAVASFLTGRDALGVAVGDDPHPVHDRLADLLAVPESEGQDFPDRRTHGADHIPDIPDHGLGVRVGNGDMTVLHPGRMGLDQQIARGHGRAGGGRYVGIALQGVGRAGSETARQSRPDGGVGLGIGEKPVL